MPQISMTAKLQDLGHNVEAFSESTTEAFRIALAGIARGAQAEWIRLAQDKLKTSRSDYINGLQQAKSFEVKKDPKGEPEYTISLVGRMPNSFEFGMAPFDMKDSRPGWLGGGKAKVNKDGKKYVRIPFRHSTSDTSPRFQYTGKAARDNLKVKLKDTVKRYGLSRMIRAATGGNVIEGPVARVPKDPAVHRYLHGLTRIQKQTSNPKRGSSIMMTWRTISETSAEDAWLHPGIVGANILPLVEKWVDEEIKRVADLVMGAA